MFCVSHLAFLCLTFHSIVFDIPFDIPFHICTVAIKNIRNMHAVSTNQIADILHFNDKDINIIHIMTAKMA